ncbi:PfkB family carbohydrate kinase [Vibrio lentus]|nr:PfkB family carbohydrate kinase [Vibrio lentus]
MADHVAFSEEGLSTFVQNSEVEAGLRLAKQKLLAKVYVTVGKHGCYWLENNELQRKAAPVIDVVDTTGAGDTFHGALVVAVAVKGWIPVLQSNSQILSLQSNVLNWVAEKVYQLAQR